MEGALRGHLPLHADGMSRGVANVSNSCDGLVDSINDRRLEDLGQRESIDTWVRYHWTDILDFMARPVS